MYMWPLTFFYVPLPEELTNFQNNYRRQAGEVINVSIEICFASFFFHGMCFTMTKIENRELTQCHLSPNGYFSQPQVHSCTAKGVVRTILGTFISETAQKECRYILNE